MQISSSPSQPLQPVLPDNRSATGRQEALNYAAGTASSHSTAAVPPSESGNTAESEHVTLTATGEFKSTAPDLVPVYAEIWKNDVKVAEIDIHGGVTPLNGLVAASQGSVSGGPLLAARRVAEIARSIGGEIRVGGQILDSQTLDMRTRLKMTYGI